MIILFLNPKIISILKHKNHNGNPTRSDVVQSERKTILTSLFDKELSLDLVN